MNIQVETNQHTTSQLAHYSTIIFLFLAKSIVGTISVGLFIGALYFLYYLIRLSRLRVDQKEFRQNKHHLQVENLLRYVIVIASIILLNILFYSYFNFGRSSLPIGVIIWILYFGYTYIASKLKNNAKN